MGTETELKYRVSRPETLGRLLGGPEVSALRTGEVAALRMESVYYDTPARALSARRWTLRVRRENGTGVTTLKTPVSADGGLSVRGEWETAASDAASAIPALMRLGAPPALAALTAGEPLGAVCGASFLRRAARLRFPDGSEAELSADLGVLTGGGREAPLCEAELELKSGGPAAMLAFAAAIAARYGLSPEEKSKYARALALADGV